MQKDGKLIIIGDRVFAEVAYEFFTHDSQYEVIAFSVERDYLSKQNLFELPVVAFEDLEKTYDPADHSFFVAVVLAAGMYLFLSHTRLGKGLRAAADNPQAAIYMGIDVDRAHRLAWSIGVGITAVAGGLVATSQTFQPYIGFDFVIVMYAGVVLGGLGSNFGAFWGGLLIGMVQQMSTLVLPYQLQNTAIFVVFLLIIFLRPQGMFGRLSERT